MVIMRCWSFLVSKAIEYIITKCSILHLESWHKPTRSCANGSYNLTFRNFKIKYTHIQNIQIASRRTVVHLRVHKISIDINAPR